MTKKNMFSDEKETNVENLTQNERDREMRRDREQE